MNHQRVVRKFLLVIVGALGAGAFPQFLHAQAPSLAVLQPLSDKAGTGAADYVLAPGFWFLVSGFWKLETGNWKLSSSQSAG